MKTRNRKVLVKRTKEGAISAVSYRLFIVGLLARYGGVLAESFVYKELMKAFEPHWTDADHEQLRNKDEEVWQNLYNFAKAHGRRTLENGFICVAGVFFDKSRHAFWARIARDVPGADNGFHKNCEKCNTPNPLSAKACYHCDKLFPPSIKKRLVTPK